MGGVLYAFAAGEESGQAAVSMAKCTKCHGVLDKVAKWLERYGLIFNHAVHFERKYRCEACHIGEVHEKGVTNRPPMDICYNCHGLSHGPQGVLAPYECGKCHPPEFDLKPAYHKKEGFFTAEHVRKAKENMRHCYTCHAQTFCVDCHIERKALPASHKAADWGETHGELPLFNIRAECYYCHDDEFCTKCHKTPMPHSIFFVGQHGPAGEKDKPDCLICHKVKFCSDCHHEKGLTLDLKVCGRCHKDLKTTMEKRTASLIFRHAPHTGFPCTDCHDAKKPTASVVMPMHGCYGSKCHGLVKAPGPGECAVCHPAEFNLVPGTGSVYGDHVAANFLRRNHADLAIKDLSKCQMCHLQKFCDDCHGTPIPHSAEFGKKHGPDARRIPDKCNYCHPDPSFCAKCHHKGYDPATMGDFITQAHPAMVKEKGAHPCFECHSPTFCAYCHVRGVKPPSIKGQ
ncbi:MAG: cytochrome c3 family protein [Actinomycetota bacterium]|nr:cytochrome c3 family protein [Actinomycetota bacterium]